MRKYIALAVIGLLLSPMLAFGQLDPDDTGLTKTGDQVYGELGDMTIGGWIGSNLIVPAFSLVGVLFLLLMIYAGFLWMTARGNETQTKKAKDLMINAVIGVIIISAAYAVTTFIFKAVG